jgi:hypothetical protein
MTVIIRDTWDDESRRLLAIYIDGPRAKHKRLATRAEIRGHMRTTLDTTYEGILDEAREWEVQAGEEAEEARMLAAEEG